MWKPAQPEDAHGWWVIQDEDGVEIGSTDGGFDEEQARLMAAAPALYQSAEMMLEAINRLISDRPVKNLDEIITFAENTISSAKH